MPHEPRYPVYVPSKGRADTCWTADFLNRDGAPFFLVVEREEREAYLPKLGHGKLLTLPQSGRGLIFARNWIKEHATEAGAERHWQFDDNITWIGRRWKARRIPCNAGAALSVCEGFVDRYENVAVAGLNYEMFLPTGCTAPPFQLNCRVYSCSLILNSLPYRWRSRYNDDTDFCLQVLSGGWCTLLFNAFYVWKKWTMQMKGGNTDALYQGDGRLKMARSLERMWPGVVETKRRFQRPQHVVKDAWKRFDTPLRLKPGIDLSAMEPNEYGMKLKQVRPIKSETLRALVEGRLE